MKNKEKKVIILENLQSPFISQAIIILKEGAECENTGIIEEAERIVGGYFKNPPKKKNKALLLGGIILASAIAFSVILRLI